MRLVDRLPEHRVDAFLTWFTTTLPLSGIRLSGRLQAWIYQRSGGRLGGWFGRGPVLVLTTTGRRSGRPRRTTVLYGTDGDRLVVIGSNAGSPRPPAWALNLAARPEAEVQVGRRRIRVRARETEGEERARLWSLMCRSYGGFDSYTERTAREFKVFALEEVG